MVQLDSIVQFVVGLLIGIVITMSVMLRVSNFNYTEFKNQLIESNMRQNNISKSNKPNLTLVNNITNNNIRNSNSTSIPWTPGKEGWIDSLKEKAKAAASEFIGGTTVETISTTSSSSSSSQSLATVDSPALTAFSVDSPTTDLQADVGGRKRKKRGDRLGTRGPEPSSSRGGGRVIDLFYSDTGKRYEGPVDDTSLKDLVIPRGNQPPRLLPYPPPVPYHSQALSPPLLPPYIPTLQGATALHNSALFQEAKHLFRPLPNMTLQQAAHERDNLKLHLCNGVFEAYSASYLTTKEHILAIKSENYNLSWVNCEMASFTHMREHRNFYVNPKAQGMIIQTLDVLDFSVIHLSAFERSSKKHKHVLWKSKEDQKVKWTEIDAVREAGKLIEAKINPRKTGQNLTYSDEARRTVVIMPFLGGAMGAGHSELGNRFVYLHACFWSMYEFFPNIVAGVSRQEDVDWVWQQSGLPFYDILLLENLPKSAGLPLGTVRKTKEKLASGEWNFDYVFFTESDQLIISRQLPMLYDHLKMYPRRMLLPHRLMPYSDRVIQEVHKRTVDHEHNRWMAQSCCLPRQNCQERKTWLSVFDPNLPVINYYGLYVPLGNVNFLNEEYRGCVMSDLIPDYCP